MTNRKFAILFTVILTIVIVLAVFNEIRQRSYTSTKQSQPTFAPVISTYLYEVSGYWTRDSSTDLPVYICTVGYSVKNYGNVDAQNVNVTIKIDEVTFNQHTIFLLKPYQEHADTFTITVNYDTTKTVSLHASCSKSSDSNEYRISARLIDGHSLLILENCMLPLMTL